MDDLETRVRKLDVEDGDLLVITSPRRLSIEQAKRLGQTIDQVAVAVGLKVTALVLDDCMDLKVIRKRTGSDDDQAIHEVKEG